MEKNYYGIFNSWDAYDDEIRKETREMLAECNDMKPEDISDEQIMQCIWETFNDERANLNETIPYGYIYAFANVGFWNGTRTGIKELGGELSNIIDYFGNDEIEIFADKYNVRAIGSNHDGRTTILFRWVDSAQDKDYIADKLHKGELTEENFIRHTKSIRPFVAKVYGWKQFGRHASK